MTKFVGQRFQRFIDKRIPRQSVMRLNHSRLFILPTRFGYSLLLMVALLFILGTNYQNNPILIVSYLLLTWFIVAMILSFTNLNNAQIRVVSLGDSEVQRNLAIGLIMKGQNQRINWCIYQPEVQHKQYLHVTPNLPFEIHYLAIQRGYQPLSALRLESRYPFGLFVCWTYLRFSNRHWIYPKPEIGDWHLDGQNQARNAELQAFLSDFNEIQQRVEENKILDRDDFKQLRNYREGESLSHVSWKHQAKNPHGEWLVKEFITPPANQQWLTFTNVSGASIEQKISVLCYACQQLSQQEQAFGLALFDQHHPPKVVPIGTGTAHLTLCLQALAGYGLDP